MNEESNFISKFIMPQVEVPTFQNKDFNIVNYGAVSNGLVMNTDFIAKAIEECYLAGGGRVVIPRGLWLTGPIHLKSNINLHVEDGAVVRFSPNYDDYPLIISNFEGYETIRCTSPIMGRNLENVAITGSGVFDGSGEVWRAVKKTKVGEKQWNELIKSGVVVGAGEDIHWWPTKMAFEGSEYSKKMGGKCKDLDAGKVYKEFFRPVLMSLVNCKKVLIDGPTFQNSAAWNLHPRLCEHITIKNIKVRNSWFSQNGDGIDIDSCKCVNISNSIFDVGDDAVCIKSGKNEEGRLIGKPTEFVSIKDCTVYHGHGGVVIGSEMSGGVRNIEVLRCTFIGTDVGLRFKSCRGRGGVVEDIYIEDINMFSVENEAITFSTDYFLDFKTVQESTPEDIPEFENFYIQNVNCVGADMGLYIVGLQEMPIRNIYLKDILIKSRKGVKIEFGHNISLDNVKVICQDNTELIFNSTEINGSVSKCESLF